MRYDCKRIILKGEDVVIANFKYIYDLEMS